MNFSNGQNRSFESKFFGKFVKSNLVQMKLLVKTLKRHRLSGLGSPSVETKQLINH